MFSLIKQVFIILLSFSNSLTTKCVIKWWTRMIKPTLIDLNPVELKYYPFMISLDKCSGSFHALSPKICTPKKAKDLSVKVFNMITNKKEAKTMAKHISYDCKCKSNSSTCNSNKKWNNEICQC